MPRRGLLCLALLYCAVLAGPLHAGSRPDKALMKEKNRTPSSGPKGERGSSGLEALALRCEQARNPLGIDAPRPRLSWQLRALNPAARGQRQTAYQVLVATSETRLHKDHPDLWDSGKVRSSDSLNIGYGGKALRSGQRAWWKVRVWDRDGRRSEESETAWWEMGLLRAEDWGAAWITRPDPPPATDRESFSERPNPLFRREFALKGPVARARAYVSGLGYYELRLNGERVGDRVLDPAWTSYGERVLYSTYDVTSLLRPGANAAGVMLGSGWYDPLPLRLFSRINLRDHLPVGPPRLILRLDVEYADGSRETVVTDEDWKAGDGPILKNSVYLGEVYDARREQPGWDRAGFDDRGWRPAVPAGQPLGPLRAQALPPIRVRGVIPAVRRTEPKPGVWIFDLGENFAGWVRLRVQGDAGARVTLRYGELLYPDGTLNPMTSVACQIKGSRANAAIGGPETAWQSDAYVLKGGGPEVWTPRFTFHGFRYVEVTGYPGEPPLEAVQGLRLHTDVESAGEFACSNVRFNQIQEVVRRTLLSNLFSVQSDCPHREKFGYGGDIVATSDMAMLNFDMARFYRKTVEDFADAARPNGGFTETAPHVGIADAGLGEGSGPVGWGTAHPLLVWQLYQYYGDRRLLEEQYEGAARWVELLRSRAKDGILENGISDHESLVPKPVALTGTAFYFYNVRLLGRMARVLGRRADTERYAALEREIRQAFTTRFLQPGTGKFDTGTQACQSFAFFMDLVPQAERQAALRVLTEDVLTARSGHLTTGIFGTKYLLHVLSELDRADVAYTIADQRDFPGWGHMLENGATTLWEHWAFSDNTYSHNHPMFGSISEWFFKALAGIQPADDASGFDRIVIRPRPVGDLRWVKAHHETVRGRIGVEWKRDGDRLGLRVEVPAGTTATVHVPAGDAASVTEGGRPAGEAEGVEFLWTEGGAAVYRVGGGRYAFQSRLPAGR